MSAAFPAPGGVTLELPLLELLILNGHVLGLIEAIEQPEDDVDPRDPLAAWEREFAGDAADDDEPDPLTRRLFPNAYPDDPQASAEFRRYTEASLRRDKVRDAGLVAEELATALGETVGTFSGTAQELLERFGDRDVRLFIPAAATPAWLKTLTALRLSLGVELGIERGEDLERLEELPDDDPGAIQLQVFDWLGYVQESVLAALGEG